MGIVLTTICVFIPVILAVVAAIFLNISRKKDLQEEQLAYEAMSTEEKRQINQEKSAALLKEQQAYSIHGTITSK